MTASSFIENLPCFLACSHSSQTERIFKIWDEFFPFAHPVTRGPARIAPHPRFPTPLAHKSCTKSPGFNLFRTESRRAPDGNVKKPKNKKEKGPCLASRGSSLCYISNIVSQKMTKSEALHIFVKGLYHVLAVRQLIRTDVARLSVDQLRQPI